ncbi:multidrug ABC transporter ATP-binding protein [Bacillus carboniphilus]|uniref:Multidrug ABC transporter ATP-binding protein n=1 Tax=Bacillus carboniphilus TaxID=86663 RepID=A0ABY9JVV8_9BACI|nr:AAA family ATPase [Bacillus carboniphilus]WLR41821.1 multidrug ABC transporter ATP-binding protein [Bacillus carboniphilus]
MCRFGGYFHPNWNQGLAEQLIDLYELPLNKKVTKFSKGMKTAAQILLGIASQAPITVFDEPTNGLDAVNRTLFYETLLSSYEEQPRMFLLSSHHIEEIQPLCESIIVLHEGKIVIHETMEQMRQRGILLTGSTTDIQQATKLVPIIESSKLGSTSTVMIDALYSKEWKERAHSHHLDIEKTTVQKYLVNKTKKKKEVIK